MELPPLQLSTKSGAETGPYTSVFDSSGWVVNLGGKGGVSTSGVGLAATGADLAPWLIGAAILAGAWWLIKRK